MTLGDGPTVFGILDQQDLDVLLVFGQAKDDAAGGGLADNFLDGWLLFEDGLLKLVNRGRAILFGERLGDLEVTSLTLFWPRISPRSGVLWCRHIRVSYTQNRGRR